MAKQNKNTNKLKNKLTKKFRLVVLNEDSFEERFSFKLTRLNVFVLGGVFSVLLIALTVLLIAFTPIKAYIPGFSSTQLKRQASQLFYKVDSLQVQISTLKKFTEAIRPILIGEETTVAMQLPYTEKDYVNLPNTFHFTDNDSLNKVLQKVRLQLDSTLQSHYQKEKNLLLKRNKESQESLIAENDSLSLQLQNNYELLKQKEDSLQKFQSAFYKSESSSVTSSLTGKKSKREYQASLSKSYRQREMKLKAEHDKKTAQLKDSLTLKEYLLDSLRAHVLAQQRKVGELSDEIPFQDIEVSEEALLIASKRDSLFREAVEREDRFSLFDYETDKVDLVFFAPVKGILTESYNVKEKHYAVDIAVPKGTAVKAIADGTVVFSAWTAGTGYVVIIEHTNKYLSVYKHNEIIYREQGDLIKSGEVIALAGTSGEYSTGPHLHFEMWFQGYPVNPENFIEFE
ncbi:peptidoglycan DD-metalloendopeptidase family protein [Flavicella sp.]|nr:peptidoglycan DD-metalloendopeptidase family protein [Flavicella sp.]